MIDDAYNCDSGDDGFDGRCQSEKEAKSSSGDKKRRARRSDSFPRCPVINLSLPYTYYNLMCIINAYHIFRLDKIITIFVQQPIATLRISSSSSFQFIIRITGSAFQHYQNNRHHPHLYPHDHLSHHHHQFSSIVTNHDHHRRVSLLSRNATMMFAYVCFRQKAGMFHLIRITI